MPGPKKCGGRKLQQSMPPASAHKTGIPEGRLERDPNIFAPAAGKTAAGALGP
jgi:hypothetical protein